MATRSNHPRPAHLLLAALLGLVTPGAQIAAQDLDKATIERLRRDQDEILRKAERLQKLMTRLKVRYEREGKQEQVDYLRQNHFQNGRAAYQYMQGAMGLAIMPRRTYDTRRVRHGASRGRSL